MPSKTVTIKIRLTSSQVEILKNWPGEVGEVIPRDTFSKRQWPSVYTLSGHNFVWAMSPKGVWLTKVGKEAQAQL